ncbi:hypothetical protein C7S16_3867 [Burkholderia thailandensis]|uniref:Uncharacterized protein n=1 Tax=Burkholderia thailandensis TaxID=57975 RepID=A0AAW9D1Z0_BURTH|nr:hypothetical protein [Burkholderia thailandensis]
MNRPPSTTAGGFFCAREAVALARLGQPPGLGGGPSWRPVEPVCQVGPSREVDATASAMRPLMLDFPSSSDSSITSRPRSAPGSPRHN